ncbi:MAG TPA: efflux RND transporter periplasmic adaptor subunit [Alphaproteobacteria bacterium]|nr:efflux RND transporter periplasmic adaptor subunit [Alphaproteobacteria bacterium]
MQTKYKIIAGLAGVAIVGWLVFGRGGHDAGNHHAPPVPVISSDVTARDVPLVLLGIGTVQAYNTVTVHARIDGELVNVAFKEGQDVKKGDLLAQIDPRPFQAALDNALATQAKDQATLANAKRDLARYQDTAPKGFSTRQQLDTQQALVDSTAAAVQADAANVENARVQLGYTTITAPLDGVTGIRLIDQGNIVHASDANGLVVVTQVQPISVIFTLPQDVLPSVVAARGKGTLAVTALDGNNTTELGDGTLELIDNQIDPATGTVKLKANFPNPGRTLWPGQFVNARLRIGVAEKGLTVPTRVIQRGQKGFYAYVIKPDNTVEVRQVVTGQEDRGQTLVTKGLNPGERVVVDGQLRLQPGATVQATDEKTAAAETEGKAPAGAPAR